MLFKLATRPSITKTIEIGAYEAGFSKKVKAARPDIAALAFEANPYVYDHFKDDVLGGDVDYRHFCVNSTGDDTNIRIPMDFRGSERELTNQMSSILSNGSTTNTKEVLVPGFCFDNEFEVNEDDEFVLWVDVEGASENVLPGCKKILEKCSAVFIEVESKPIWEGQWLDTDINKFFVENGFYPALRDFQSPGQYNVIYLNTKYKLNMPVLRQFWTMIDQTGLLQGHASAA